MRDFSTKQIGQKLRSIADSKDRNSGLENAFIALWRIFPIYIFGAARQDNADGMIAHHAFVIRVIGQKLAVDILFADTPRDQLIILTAEIQDNYSFSHVPSDRRGKTTALKYRHSSISLFIDLHLMETHRLKLFDHAVLLLKQHGNLLFCDFDSRILLLHAHAHHFIPQRR